MCSPIGALPDNSGSFENAVFIVRYAYITSLGCSALSKPILGKNDSYASIIAHEGTNAPTPVPTNN